MKRFIYSTILLALLSGCSSDSSPESNLQNSLDKYTECIIDNDFDCQVEYINPVNFKELDFSASDIIEIMKSSGVTIVEFHVGKPSTINKNGDILTSTIPYSETSIIHGEKITSDNLTLHAVSTDNGSTWLYNSTK